MWVKNSNGMVKSLFLLLVEFFYPFHIVWADILTLWTNSTMKGVVFGCFVQEFLWFLESYCSFVTSEGISFHQHIG
jgi:hypothetical protein